MTELTIIDKIDLVLSLFKPSLYKHEYGETKKTINEKLLSDYHVNIGDRLLDEILIKIENDRYLRSITDASIIRNGLSYIADPKIYLLTVEGEFFLNSGGYKGQQQREINPLRKLKVRLLNMAAGVAGVYYLFEIIRLYIVPAFQHICDCQFVWQSKP